VEASREAAFVLVAGGLGERLGYSGIKIALPTDLARGACFLQVMPLGLLTLPSKTILHV
jgi:UDP-sugar pyrophosphorylase